MPSDVGGWEPGRRSQGNGARRQKPKADVGMIRRALDILVAPESVVELRIPHTPHQGTVSGYFDDLSKIAQCAGAMSGKADGVYVTLNPVNRDLLARASNRLVSFAKHTTSDNDVVRLCWFLIDFDPMRPAGISSTDAEHEAALERARQCREWLSEQGWPEPTFADSGNGAHLLYRVDLPNNGSSCELLKSCLEALGFRFSDPAVEVDLNTGNPGRLVKIYGTLAAKGDNLPERPHRLASLLHVSHAPEPVADELLAALAARIPKAESHGQVESGQGKAGGFDLERWIADHDLKVDSPRTWKSGRLWLLRVCPWNSEHTDGSAYILRFATGAIGAGCHHESCRDKNWHALRDVVEPRWRNHSAQHKSGAWAERKLRFITAAQLATEAPEEAEWIVQGLAAKGGITELGSKIKTGKTTLTLQMVRAVLDGRDFLGLPTLKSPCVVYLTEQPKGSFRAQLKEAGLLGRPELVILHFTDAFGLSWPEVALQVLRECEARGSRLLVVDTVFRFGHRPGLKENDAEAALEIMRPLEEIAAKGIAVWGNRHDRKAGGEVGDSARGSSAFGGVADIILSLRRPGGRSRRTVRRIEALSRFSETPQELMIELTLNGYVTLGSGAAFAAAEARQAILAALPRAEADALTQQELFERSRVGRGTGQRASRNCKGRAKSSARARAEGRMRTAIGRRRFVPPKLLL